MCGNGKRLLQSRQVERTLPASSSLRQHQLSVEASSRTNWVSMRVQAPMSPFPPTVRATSNVSGAFSLLDMHGKAKNITNNTCSRTRLDFNSQHITVECFRPKATTELQNVAQSNSCYMLGEFEFDTLLPPWREDSNSSIPPNTRISHPSRVNTRELTLILHQKFPVSTSFMFRTPPPKSFSFTMLGWNNMASMRSILKGGTGEPPERSKRRTELEGFSHQAGLPGILCGFRGSSSGPELRFEDELADLATFTHAAVVSIIFIPEGV
ncbi:hypothetical protein CIRG_01198 [Coccidioides immitis RMSCC 2394]|uniref:Uncharacterized protein n=1 Tax=Coccidioides immitis RMSCC 2394 TaxID=404692 RepID=A0A0J6Y366_COCIT|nr:hypothetical protein CIRG_01198 [Coccidioides immitis RMSCC 2394]